MAGGERAQGLFAFAAVASSMSAATRLAFSVALLWESAAGRATLRTVMRRGRYFVPGLWTAPEDELLSREVAHRVVAMLWLQLAFAALALALAVAMLGPLSAHADYHRPTVGASLALLLPAKAACGMLFCLAGYRSTDAVACFTFLGVSTSRRRRRLREQREEEQRRKIGTEAPPVMVTRNLLRRFAIVKSADVALGLWSLPSVATVVAPDALARQSPLLRSVSALAVVFLLFNDLWMSVLVYHAESLSERYWSWRRGREDGEGEHSDDAMSICSSSGGEGASSDDGGDPCDALERADGEDACEVRRSATPTDRRALRRARRARRRSAEEPTRRGAPFNDAASPATARRRRHAPMLRLRAGERDEGLAAAAGSSAWGGHHGDYGGDLLGAHADGHGDPCEGVFTAEQFESAWAAAGDAEGFACGVEYVPSAMSLIAHVQDRGFSVVASGRAGGALKCYAYCFVPVDREGTQVPFLFELCVRTAPTMELSARFKCSAAAAIGDCVAALDLAGIVGNYTTITAAPRL